MKHKYLKNVTTLTLAAEKCVGCGKCSEVCPHRVIKLNGEKAQIMDQDSCMECGACALNCPTKALAVNAGVGCAVAIITGWLTGKEPSCGCADNGDKTCC